MCVLLHARVLSAEISTVICDKVDKAQVLLDNVERRDTPGLRRIILMDAFDMTLVEHGKRCGVHVQALQEVEVCDLGFQLALAFIVGQRVCNHAVW